VNAWVNRMRGCRVLSVGRQWTSLSSWRRWIISGLVVVVVVVIVVMAIRSVTESVLNDDAK